MKRYELKITTEHGKVAKITREICYGAEGVDQAKAHAKAMAITGSTVLFDVSER